MKHGRFLLCLYAVMLMSLTVVTMQSPVRGQPLLPDYPIDEIAVSGDGTRLAVSGRFEQISIDEWLYYVDILDTSSLEIISSVEIGSWQPSRLNLSADGRWIVYNVDYLVLRAVDTISDERIDFVGRGPVEVGAVDLNPVDGRLAYSLGMGITVRSLYGDFSDAYLHDEETPGLVTTIAWSSNGHELATKTYSRVDETFTIQIWDESQLNSRTMVDSPRTRFAADGGRLIWSPDDELIALGSRGNVVLFDPDTGEQSILSTGTLQNITTMTWNPDGTQFAAASTGIIWIWDVATGEIVDTITVDGLVDAMVWVPALGLIHNRYGDAGVYQNGSLVTAPIIPTTTTSTAVP